MNPQATGEIRPNSDLSALSVPDRLSRICRELEDVGNAIQPGSLLWFVVDLARQTTRVALSDAKLPGAPLTAPTDSLADLRGRIDRLHDDIHGLSEIAQNLHDSMETPFRFDRRLRHLATHLAEASKRVQLARPYALALDGKAEADIEEGRA